MAMQLSLENELIHSNEALKEEMMELDVKDIWMAYAIPPSDEFVMSVRRLGVVEPIIVAPNTHGESYPYRVVAGRRRLTAARMVGLEKIKAVVRQYEGIPTSLLVSLAENDRRSDNPIAKYRALQQLIQRGYMLEEIVEITGIPSDRILRMMTLSNVGDEILEGVEQGTVALGTALAMAKLSDRQRLRAKNKFFETGKLTGKDVLEARHADIGAAVQQASELLQEALAETFATEEGYDGRVDVAPARISADLVSKAAELMRAYEITYDQWQENAWKLAIEKIERAEKAEKRRNERRA